MNNPTEQLKEAEETIERLKRELEFARQENKRTLQDARESDLNNYRLEVESIKKKNDLNHLRIQAEEVAKRRKLEKEIIKLKSDLQASKQEMSRYQLDLEETRQELSEQKEKTRLEAQEEIAGIRMQAKEAWRHAEDETARLDGELAKLKQRLNNEKAHRSQAEKTISKLENIIARQRQNEVTSSETDQLDKRHFDKLLKKAHLAIKNLQEKLKLSNSERDDYLKELTEIRSQLIEHKLEDILKESHTEKPNKAAPADSKEATESNVTYRAGEFTKKRAEGLKRPLPMPPPEISLDQPIFDDEFSDELLLIEPDTSFDQNQNEQPENRAKTKGDNPEKPKSPKPPQQKKTKQPPPQQPKPATPPENRSNARLTGLHSSIEETLDEILDDDDLIYDDDNVDVAEITRELLQEPAPAIDKKRPAKRKEAAESMVTSPNERAAMPFHSEPEPKRRSLYFTLSICLILIAAGGYGAWWLKNHNFTSERLASSPTYQRLKQKQTETPSQTAATETVAEPLAKPVVANPATPKPAAIKPAPSVPAAKPAQPPKPKPVPAVPVNQPERSAPPTSGDDSFQAKPIPEQKPVTESVKPKPISVKPKPDKPATKPTPAKPAMDQRALEQELQARIEEERRLREEAEAELRSAIEKLNPVNRVIQ